MIIRARARSSTAWTRSSAAEVRKPILLTRVQGRLGPAQRQDVQRQGEEEEPSASLPRLARWPEPDGVAGIKQLDQFDVEFVA